MRLTKHIFLLAFVLFWTAASAHCKWENLSALNFFKCDSAQSTPVHCGDEVCVDVEDGQFFQIQQSPLKASVFAALPFQFPVPDEFATDKPSVFAVPEKSPELPVRWQFTSRAALPVRAPSLVS